MKWTCLASILVAAACSSSGNHGGADASGDGSHTGDGSNQLGDRTVFTILLENHDYAEIIGSSNAPYINSLLATGVLETSYKDTIHPSLGNYLHMISGANQYPGVVDLDPTTIPFPVNKPNLATQLEAANIKWRSYQESMGTPCKLSSSGDYAPKHDPFLYFTDQQKAPNNLCADTNVDYSNFAADLATNSYRYMWITPNLTDDGHNPSNDPVAALKTADHWMSVEVPKILASDGYKNGGILFITWDEAEGRNGDDGDKIPMIVLSPRLKSPGTQVATAMTHSSYTATIDDLFGFQRLAAVTSDPSMADWFNP